MDAASKMLLRTQAFILAGGQGQRLFPLTWDRAKPAVPFGGVHRLIDFTLSNCFKGFIRKEVCKLSRRCRGRQRQRCEDVQGRTEAFGFEGSSVDERRRYEKDNP